MAWEHFKVEEQRLQLITAYMNKEASMTNLCKKYGVSRKTGYKWLGIFLDSSEKGLKNRSKAPQEPYRLYNLQQLQMAVDLKLKYRTWGPKKVIAKLEALYPNLNWPSPTRLYEFFKEHHLVISRKIRHRVPLTAPLGDLSDNNDTWAVDLKGWVLTGDGKKCEPLTITDCHSRYLIRCTYIKRHTAADVWSVFEDAFREYGLPNRLRSDNGPPFGSVGAGRLTRLSINLIKAGVIPEWIRPGHPEENGRHERLHLTLQQDILSPPQPTLFLQIELLKQFQEMYNHERPHEALGMKTPGSCYSKSTKSWSGVLKSPEYNTTMEVRKVFSNGCISINKKEYYITQALEGEYVGLKKIDDNVLESYYGPIYLGNICKGKGLEKPKMMTRKKAYYNIKSEK